MNPVLEEEDRDNQRIGEKKKATVIKNNETVLLLVPPPESVSESSSSLSPSSTIEPNNNQQVDTDYPRKESGSQYTSSLPHDQDPEVEKDRDSTHIGSENRQTSSRPESDVDTEIDKSRYTADHPRLVLNNKSSTASQTLKNTSSDEALSRKYREFDTHLPVLDFNHHQLLKTTNSVPTLVILTESCPQDNMMFGLKDDNPEERQPILSTSHGNDRSSSYLSNLNNEQMVQLHEHQHHFYTGPIDEYSLTNVRGYQTSDHPLTSSWNLDKNHHNHRHLDFDIIVTNRNNVSPSVSGLRRAHSLGSSGFETRTHDGQIKEIILHSATATDDLDPNTLHLEGNS